MPRVAHYQAILSLLEGPPKTGGTLPVFSDEVLIYKERRPMKNNVLSLSTRNDLCGKSSFNYLLIHSFTQQIFSRQCLVPGTGVMAVNEVDK